MSQVVRLPNTLINRLKPYAEPFESHAVVLEKIIDKYEQLLGQDTVSISYEEKKDTPISVDIDYLSGSEESFKKEFLVSKKAYIKLYYIGGKTEVKLWELRGLTETSSISANLRSGRLRGWKDKGIYKVELSIDLNKLNSSA